MDVTGVGIVGLEFFGTGKIRGMDEFDACKCFDFVGEQSNGLRGTMTTRFERLVVRHGRSEMPFGHIRLAEIKNGYDPGSLTGRNAAGIPLGHFWAVLVGSAVITVRGPVVSTAGFGSTNDDDAEEKRLQMLFTRRFSVSGYARILMPDGDPLWVSAVRHLEGWTLDAPGFVESICPTVGEDPRPSSPGIQLLLP